MKKKSEKVITRNDIVKTADTVMDIIKSRLGNEIDIAQIVISECQSRILQEKQLRFCNPRKNS